MGEELKKTTAETTERILKIVIAPINSRNPLFVSALIGSIGMFIADYNSLVAIPQWIVWLPLLLCFLPAIIFLAVLGALALLWCLVMLVIVLGAVFSLLFQSARVAWRALRLKFRKRTA